MREQSGAAACRTAIEPCCMNAHTDQYQYQTPSQRDEHTDLSDGTKHARKQAHCSIALSRSRTCIHHTTHTQHKDVDVVMSILTFVDNEIEYNKPESAAVMNLFETPITRNQIWLNESKQTNQSNVSASATNAPPRWFVNALNDDGVANNCESINEQQHRSINQSTTMNNNQSNQFEQPICQCRIACLK